MIIPPGIRTPNLLISVLLFTVVAPRRIAHYIPYTRTTLTQTHHPQHQQTNNLIQPTIKMNNYTIIISMDQIMINQLTINNLQFHFLMQTSIGTNHSSAHALSGSSQLCVPHYSPLIEFLQLHPVYPLDDS
jgi:hypothetical protein